MKQMHKRQKLATGMAAEGAPSCCPDEDELSRLQVGALCQFCSMTSPLIISYSPQTATYA